MVEVTMAAVVKIAMAAVVVKIAREVAVVVKIAKEVGADVVVDAVMTTRIRIKTRANQQDSQLDGNAAQRKNSKLPSRSRRM